ncbi:hypothetical protein DYU11_18485 [Fibrisoma montanum]|uniref:M15 family peptidase n=1 Tax=Fibrisoma montanum TaxID=2305895 RepID=A0A418M6A2_9BACT|nr:hypothetical protein [Fibrisoma montanum]RIV21394.1 hypothetical protein DYU11_18485 [Fibrisoma montanum]
MPSSRNIADAVVTLQRAWLFLKQEYNSRYPSDPVVMLTEVHRPAEVQRAYYAQGRQKLSIVNRLRQGAGLSVISEAENRRKVTFKQPGTSKHEKMPSQAFDIAFRNPDGTLNWDEKYFDRAARIIRERFPNVTWGADWDRDGRSDDEKFVDRPHFEV